MWMRSSLRILLRNEFQLRNKRKGEIKPEKLWSGRRGSNPQPTAWEAATLPLSYSRSKIRAVTQL